MSKINVLLIFALFTLLLFPSCSEDDDNSPDGDSDTSITDGDGESSLDGDTEVDGDSTVTVHTCDEASPYAFTTDTAVFEGWQDDCRNFEAVYNDPELTEYHQQMGYTCSPVRLKLEGIGETVFCEVARDGATASESYSWLGPGYGCAWGPSGGDVRTGWQADVGVNDAVCLGAWTEQTAQVLFERHQPETNCEDIDDLQTCITAHHPPYHCKPVFSWPIEWDQEECNVRGSEDRVGAELDEAEFLACRTVKENHDNSDNHSGESFLGTIKNDQSGVCVGISEFTGSIPEGWTIVNCDDCTTR